MRILAVPNATQLSLPTCWATALSTPSRTSGMRDRAVERQTKIGVIPPLPTRFPTIVVQPTSHKRKGLLSIDLLIYKIPPETKVDDMSNEQVVERFLHILRGGGTSDNLDQLASNDGLTGAVVEDLVLVDHLAGVLGGVLDGGVSTSRGKPAK